MKRAFTIVEVSILFVIFLIVAFLVAPLSLDDSNQARNTARWRSVQGDFDNIFYAVNNLKEDGAIPFEKAFELTIANDIKGAGKSYKINALGKAVPDELYRFNEFKTTYSNASVAYKLFDEPQDNIKGLLMYDVNGKAAPNTWGKDVFGFNIYEDKLEPFCKNKSLKEQKRDCSRYGTGICCSNYYLVGGSYD